MLHMERADELSRLKERIADFERCIAEMGEKSAEGSPCLGSAERIQMLRMLRTTLQAMKARRVALERGN
jgi:hypothetical protein